MVNVLGRTVQVVRRQKISGFGCLGYYTVPGKMLVTGREEVAVGKRQDMQSGRGKNWREKSPVFVFPVERQAGQLRID